jgi:hypothetical protein
MNSQSKKIDVDELRHKLAEGLRGRAHAKGNDISMSTGNGGSNFNTSKENMMKKMNRSSRSKSPGHTLKDGFSTSYDEVPERGSAVKFDKSSHSINASGLGAEPAWYKALKKHSGAAAK